MAITFVPRVIGGRNKSIFEVSPAALGVSARILLEETMFPIDIVYLNLVDAQTDPTLDTFDKKLAACLLPNGAYADVIFKARIFEQDALARQYERQDNGGVTPPPSPEVDLDEVIDRLDTVEGVAANVSGRVSTLEMANTTNTGKITTVEGKVATLETANTTNTGKITAIETLNTTQNGRLTTLETANTTNTGKITTVEGKVATLETANTTNTGKITTLEGKVATLETANTTNTGKITAIETLNTTQNNRLTAVEGSVSTAQSGVNTNTAAISDLDGRVTALEAAPE